MKAFFNPQSVVLIGVSRQTGLGAYNGLEMMLRYGYRGRIFVVHPQSPEILGHHAYAAVADLPEAPELAVIALARDRVLPVVEACLDKGIRCFVIISQGFADADATGTELQDRMVDVVRTRGGKLVGPNTMGVMNAFTGFTTAFVDVVRYSDPPPVSLISQSGAPQVGSESFVGPLGQALDIGNAADVGFTEVLEYLEHDPRTSLIVLHMEGLQGGREFLRAAARVGRRKPIVVLKTGRSPEGARAALSHTGSMVGADEVFSEAFRRAGILRARDTQDLLHTVKALRQLPLLQGPRIGIATPSGAMGILALDALSEEGLGPGPLPEIIPEAVEPQGPSWHRLHNPVDLWPIGMKTGDFLRVSHETLQAFLIHPDIDGIMLMLPALSSPLHRNILATAKFLGDLDLARHGKPVVVALYGDMRGQVQAELDRVPGVAAYFSVEEAARALGRLYRYQQYQAQPLESFPLGAESAQGPPPPFCAQDILLGEEALQFLAGHGIPTVSGILTHTLEDAATAAHQLGFPVVLKVVSPQWVHKWEQGGVALNLGSDIEVRRAWERLRQAVDRASPPVTLTGILVQKQVQGREILLGIKQDATFGPVVVCGLGGIYTEVFRDLAQTLTPVTPGQARDLLGQLKSFPLLTGFRGEPPVALETVAEALSRLSRVALGLPGLQELDINPLVANQQGCWAVDARIILASRV